MISHMVVTDLGYEKMCSFAFCIMDYLGGSSSCPVGLLFILT